MPSMLFLGTHTVTNMASSYKIISSVNDTLCTAQNPLVFWCNEISIRECWHLTHSRHLRETQKLGAAKATGFWSRTSV